MTRASLGVVPVVVVTAWSVAAPVLTGAGVSIPRITGPAGMPALVVPLPALLVAVSRAFAMTSIAAAAASAIIVVLALAFAVPAARIILARCPTPATAVVRSCGGLLITMAVRFPASPLHVPLPSRFPRFLSVPWT